MKPEIKKLLILNLPYLLFVWLFDKVGAAVRLSPGADASAKLLHLGDGFTTAFSSIAPSFHPADLALGIAGAVIVRLIIYTKGKNFIVGEMLVVHIKALFPRSVWALFCFSTAPASFP